MFNLLHDLVAAAFQALVRRIVVRLRASPRPVADAPPTGGGCAATATSGGHPESEATSTLLRRAAWLLDELPVSAALRDRAAAFAAHGD